jgi:hypothetical protein
LTTEQKRLVNVFVECFTELVKTKAQNVTEEYLENFLHEGNDQETVTKRNQAYKKLLLGLHPDKLPNTLPTIQEQDRQEPSKLIVGASTAYKEAYNPKVQYAFDIVPNDINIKMLYIAKQKIHLKLNPELAEKADKENRLIENLRNEFLSKAQAMDLSYSGDLSKIPKEKPFILRQSTSSPEKFVISLNGNTTLSILPQYLGLRAQIYVSVNAKGYYIDEDNQNMTFEDIINYAKTRYQKAITLVRSLEFCEELADNAKAAGRWKSDLDTPHPQQNIIFKMTHWDIPFEADIIFRFPKPIEQEHILSMTIDSEGYHIDKQTMKTYEEVMEFAKKKYDEIHQLRQQEKEQQVKAQAAKEQEARAKAEQQAKEQEARAKEQQAARARVEQQAKEQEARAKEQQVARAKAEQQAKEQEAKAKEQQAKDQQKIKRFTEEYSNLKEKYSSTRKQSGIKTFFSTFGHKGSRTRTEQINQLTAALTKLKDTGTINALITFQGTLTMIKGQVEKESHKLGKSALLTLCEEMDKKVTVVRSELTQQPEKRRKPSIRR